MLARLDINHVQNTLPDKEQLGWKDDIHSDSDGRFSTFYMSKIISERYLLTMAMAMASRICRFRCNRPR